MREIKQGIKETNHRINLCDKFRSHDTDNLKFNVELKTAKFPWISS